MRASKNGIEEQPNKNESNMPQETTNNPRNNLTMPAEKSVEKLPSSTDSADNNVVSSDEDNSISNIRRSEKKNDKKTSQQSPQIMKRLLIVEDTVVKQIEPYKMKKSTKYIATVKLIPGAITKGMIHHVKGCRVDFAPDIVLLHCGTNDLKKYLTPQKTAQNILKLAEEVSGGCKRDVLVCGIINRVDDHDDKVQKIKEFLSETRTRKNVKSIGNGNIGLTMSNPSKLYLSRFGTIQLVKFKTMTS